MVARKTVESASTFFKIRGFRILLMRKQGSDGGWGSLTSLQSYYITLLYYVLEFQGPMGP